MTTTNRTTANKKKATPKEMHQVSAAARARAFKRIQAVLKDQGIAGKISAMHFDAAAAPAAEANGCPPGQVMRVVCELQPDGTMQCEPRCTPA